MGSTGLLSAIVTLALFIAIGGGYTAVAWLIHRRWHLPGLTVLWTCCSAAYGFVSFGVVCSHPLTCDVGDSYSSYYLTHVAPFYALVGGAGFAAASAVILVRSRLGGDDRLRATGLVVGTLATMGGWMLGMFIAPKLLSW